MTPSRCTVCLSADRPAIDAMLANGNGLRALASRFHVSRSSLHRHSAHAPHAMGPAKANGATTTPATAPARVPTAMGRPAPTGRARGKRGSVMPPLETTVARPLAPNLPAPSPQDTTAVMVNELQSVVRRHLVSLGGDDCLTTFDRSKLEASAVSALGLLARLKGRTDALAEVKVVRHPAVRRVLDAVVAAVAPWPAATTAVLNALRELAGMR